MTGDFFRHKSPKKGCGPVHKVGEPVVFLKKGRGPLCRGPSGSDIFMVRCVPRETEII